MQWGHCRRLPEAYCTTESERQRQRHTHWLCLLLAACIHDNRYLLSYADTASRSDIWKLHYFINEQTLQQKEFRRCDFNISPCWRHGRHLQYCVPRTHIITRLWVSTCAWMHTRTHVYAHTHTHAYMQGTCTHNVHAAKLTRLFLYSVLILAVGLPLYRGDTESIWVTHYTSGVTRMWHSGVYCNGRMWYSGVEENDQQVEWLTSRLSYSGVRVNTLE